MKSLRGDRDFVPCVRFLPFRCPRCGAFKPRTYTVRARLRYHQCQACGQRYKSLEIEQHDLPEWSPPPEATSDD